MIVEVVATILIYSLVCEIIYNIGIYNMYIYHCYISYLWRDIVFFDSIKFNNMFNENDSLIKGTIFANEYKPYKNYKESNINVSNDKENLLLTLL